MARTGSSLAGGLVGVVVVAGLWLSGDAVWLALRDPEEFAAHRRESLQRLGDERARLQASLTEARQRSAKLATDLAATQKRARDADRAIKALRTDDHWWRTLWDKLFGDAQGESTKEDRLARLEATRTMALGRVPELRSALTRATWERDGAEIALAQAERRLAALERETTVRHYLARAWKTSRGYVIGALAVWLVAVVVWIRSRPPRAPGVSGL
jgi:hypothetical protein